MRHFISFQKKKALYLEPGDADNTALAHELNHELMAVGYVLSRDAFQAVASQDLQALTELHADLMSGIRAVVGGAGHEPIYRNFPQSVLALSYEQFLVNALVHYWSLGTWRPEDADYIRRELRVEAVDYTPVGLMNEARFRQIFEDLLYGEVSLSGFDKRCVDWWLDQGGALAFDKIRFKEIAAHVGKRLIDADPRVLPIHRATTVLRVWSAYCGGDEGLKTNTRFKSPTARQRRLLLRTLEGCGDLEDSFKGQRERWLRLLLYLHPTTAVNRELYPRVADHAQRLRASPTTLRTFNSRVEWLLKAKDPALLKLLATRPGAFMRRLDHLVRTFGVEAMYAWLALDLPFTQLVTAYNHFSGRDKEAAGRGAVLAGQDQSQLVTYAALEPLPSALVEHIVGLLIERLRSFEVPALGGPVFIDPGLYYAPLATNNRAASLSLDGKVIGKVETYDAGETLRAYVHWAGRSDIDLSGFIITQANEVVKVGWNGHHKVDGYLVYSGDNTGHADKNAEYLDINTAAVPADVEWIIVEARIFRGPPSFADYDGSAHVGWMSRKHPKANKQWLPETLQHAMVLTNAGTVAYLMAYHPRSRSIVYLDLSMGSAQVSTAADAMRIRLFLEAFVPVKIDHTPTWARLNQGHILELLAGELAASPTNAEVTFDATTQPEQVSRLMSEAVIVKPPGAG